MLQSSIKSSTFRLAERLIDFCEIARMRVKPFDNAFELEGVSIYLSKFASVFRSTNSANADAKHISKPPSRHYAVNSGGLQRISDECFSHLKIFDGGSHYAAPDAFHLICTLFAIFQPHDATNRNSSLTPSRARGAGDAAGASLNVQAGLPARSAAYRRYAGRGIVAPPSSGTW